MRTSQAAERVVLLSDGLWQRRFGRDKAIIGKTLMLNEVAYTVVGVMGPAFKFPEDSELWIPLRESEGSLRRDFKGLFTFARLAPGTSIERARTSVTQVAARLATEYPENADWSVKVTLLRDEFIPSDIKLITLTMMGAVTFVLLIACANVANLMLARATSRAREIAIRSALGAGRHRIVRQLLTESVILAIAGGLLGIPIAAWGLELIDMAIPPSDAVPYYIDWAIDRPTLIYTVIISIVTGVLFGLAPALQAARGSLQAALRDGARGSGASMKKNRLRSSLVVAEIALSLVLLVGALLFVRSFLTLQNASAGFSTAHLMTTRFYLQGTRYDSLSNRARRAEDILQRIEALPGVQSAFVSPLIPATGGAARDGILVEGRAVEKGLAPPGLFAGVTEHFFSTLGLKVVSGREFTSAETRDSIPLAVINQTMAKRLWPGADPLGHRFRYAADSTGPWYTVIGVVPDIANDDLDNKDPVSAAYLPLRYALFRGNGLVVKTTGDPAAITPSLRRAIRESDPTIALYDVNTMEQVRKLGFWQYAPVRVDVLGVRRNRAGARGGRRLRRDLVQRFPAHAGDRRPRGARRPPCGCAEARRGAGDAVGGDRPRDRPGGRVRRDARRAESPLRRHADGSGELRAHHGVPDGGGCGCELVAGSARDRSRSDRGTQAGLDEYWRTTKLPLPDADFADYADRTGGINGCASRPVGSLSSSETTSGDSRASRGRSQERHRFDKVGCSPLMPSEQSA